MKAKKLLVNELIKSLNENYTEWVFNNYAATNKKTGVSIWIANIPILNIEVHSPTSISFGLIDKIRIYRALNECRIRYVISVIQNPQP